MKILQITPNYYPRLGGVERHVQSMSEALVQAGHTVEVWTLSDGRPETVEVGGVTVRRFRAIGPGVYRFPVGLFRALRRQMQQFDVVHAHNYHSLPLPITLLAGVEHCVVSLYYHRQAHSRFANLLHRIYDPVAKLALRGAGKIVCLSEGEAQQVVEHLAVDPSRIAILPSGVTLPEASLQEQVKRDPFLILSVGRLEAYKRVDRLLSTLACLPQPYYAVIVGQGPQREQLEQIAASLQISDRVRFVGRIGDAELEQWYERAGLLASFSEAESFGIAVVEALAHRCRIICSDIPAFRDFAVEFPKAVILTDSTLDSKQIAGLIQAAPASADTAPVDLRRYTWPVIVQNLLQIYDGMIPVRAGSRR